MKYIPLTQGKYALVDDKDFSELSKFKWYAHAQKSVNNTFYAVRTLIKEDRKKTMIYMHRCIANTPQGMATDHIDGNGLNNQISNLRVCTTKQNLCNKGKQINNTSGLKGVSWHKATQRWRATLNHNGKSIHLGGFDSKEFAREAYVFACRKYQGEFANLK